MPSTHGYRELCESGPMERTKTRVFRGWRCRAEYRRLLITALCEVYTIIRRLQEEIERSDHLKWAEEFTLVNHYGSEVESLEYGMDSAC